MNRRSLLLSLIGSVVPTSTFAQRRRPLRLLVHESLPRLDLLVDAISTSLPFGEIAVAAQEARPAQIVARFSAQANVAELPDLAILPTPDLAVQLANEGRTFPQVLESGFDVPHWRSEVFVLGHDPAVFVTRKGSIAEQDLPRTRLDLARMLEQGGNRFQGRAGIVNVGTDSVAYAIASQDSLRSSMFWRISAAFGASRARIFDTADELLSALSAGTIDFGYNIPITSARSFLRRDSEIEIIVPQDYVLGLPWCGLVPHGVTWPGPVPQAGGLVSLLTSQRVFDAFSEIGLITPQKPSVIENIQMIDPGPELLVFLDPLKRSRFLDLWFGLVVQN